MGTPRCRRPTYLRIDRSELFEKITMQQACNYAQKSDATIRTWIKKGFFKAFRPNGGAVIIDRDSFLDFMDGKDMIPEIYRSQV